MRVFFMFLVMLPCYRLAAQVTQTYYGYNWKETDVKNAQFFSEAEKTDSGWRQVDYFVTGPSVQMIGLYADEAKKIKHGHFSWYYHNKVLKESVLYRNNKPEGLRISFHPNGQMDDSIFYRNGILQGFGLSWHSNGLIADSLVHVSNTETMRYSWFENGYPDCTGLLVNGEKEGKWLYFHDNSRLAAEIVYSKGEKVSTHYFNEDGSPAAPNAETDREPVFTGKKGLRAYIESKLRWPYGYTLDGDVVAVVSVSFTVNAEGDVTEAYINTPLHPEFDKVALKAITGMPRWKPGLEHNRRKKTYHLQAMAFALE